VDVTQTKNLKEVVRHVVEGVPVVVVEVRVVPAQVAAAHVLRVEPLTEVVSRGILVVAVLVVLV
jgi:hypothetical protein